MDWTFRQATGRLTRRSKKEPKRATVLIAISDNVQIRKDKPSGTIVLNRPNRCNALSREMVNAIKQGFEDLYQENGVRAVILTGTGSTFCAGTDLQEIKETAEGKDANRIWMEDVSRFQELIEYLLRYPKPIICGVNGWVVGSGAALLMASDFVVADNRAQFQMPEARRGLFSGIAAALLAFRLGPIWTNQMLLSGATIENQAAVKTGLFHEAVEPELVWARCQQLAEEISQGAQQSHQLTKKLINETIGEELFTQISIGAANTAAARTTDAAIEGINAFLEKREPQW